MEKDSPHQLNEKLTPNKKKKPPIKRLGYYILLIINLSLTQTYMAFNDITISAILHSIRTALGWTETNENLNLSLSQTMPLFGTVLAAFIYPRFMKKKKPTTVIAISKLLYVGLICLTLVKDTTVFITARFFIGLTLGIQLPTCISTLYECTLIKHRHRTGNIIGASFSIGIVVGYGVSSLVNAGTIDYQMFYAGIAALALLDLICFLLFLKWDKSPLYLILTGKEEKALKTLQFYLEEEAALAHFNEMKEAALIKKESLRRKEKFFTEYKPEFKFSLLFVTIINLSTYYVFTVYAILLITEDMDDKSEASRSSLFLSIAGFIELGFKLFYISFNLNKKRKNSLVMGISILGTMMIINGYFEYEGYWEYCKYLVIFAFVTVGFISGTFFSVLPEYFPQSVVGMTTGLNNLTGGLLSFAFPLFDVKRDNNQYIHVMSCSMGGLCFLSAILMNIFLFEPGGKSRAEIHRHFRRK